jgi:hypothetical protein
VRSCVGVSDVRRLALWYWVSGGVGDVLAQYHSGRAVEARRKAPAAAPMPKCVALPDEHPDGPAVVTCAYIRTQRVVLIDRHCASGVMAGDATAGRITCTVLDVNIAVLGTPR